MVCIELKITKVLIPFKIKRTLPSSWAELSFFKASSLLPAILSKNNLLVLAQLLRIKLWVLNLIPDYAILQLLEQISFMKELPNTFTFNKIKNHKFTNLTEVSIIQWAYIEFFALKYAIDRKEEYLNKFIAAIYLKDNYTDENINRFVDVNKMIYNQKMFIFLVYQNERKAFIAKFPYVFPTSEPTENEETSSKTQSIDFMHAFKLLNDVVNSRIYGTYTQTCETKLATILFNKNLENQK